jgi:hypothetical protein
MVEMAGPASRGSLQIPKGKTPAGPDFMAREEFDKLVEIQEGPDPMCPECWRLEGRINLRDRRTISPHYSDLEHARAHQRRAIRETLWRTLYDDKRRLFVNKLRDLYSCNPGAPWEMRNKITEIVKMAEAL